MYYRPCKPFALTELSHEARIFIKECQQKLDPDLNPWLQLRSEQLRSGAGQPVHMCLFCSLKSWETWQGTNLGMAWEGWRDAPSHECRLHRTSGCSLFSGFVLGKCCPSSSWPRRQFCCWYSWVFAPGTQHKENIWTSIWTTDLKLKYLLKIALTLNSSIVLNKIIVLK